MRGKNLVLSGQVLILLNWTLASDTSSKIMMLVIDILTKIYFRKRMISRSKKLT